MSEGTCKECGAKVVWVKVKKTNSEEIINIPLDPSAPVYEVDPVNPSSAERTKSAMVTHFKTCPKASQFSGGAPKT